MRDVALIGGGYWGKNLARNLHSLGVLHTLCDTHEQTLNGFSTGYEGVEKTTSVDAVLDNSAISKVFIAAPAALHYTLAKSALLRGKDVFVEKPLCLTVPEAEELVALSGRLEKILMVGHLLQYHPCIQKIKELIATGDLGRLQYITSNRLNLGKIRREENALWSFAPHDLSVILSLVGDRLPVSLQCTGGGWLTPGVADTTLTSMRFDGEVLAHVFVSWLNPFKEQKLTVVGSHGMVVFDDTLEWDKKLMLYRHQIAWQDGIVPTAGKVVGEPVQVVTSEPLRNECIHFLECCSHRRQPRTDGKEGLQVLRVLAMAQSSLDAAGKSVSAADIVAHPAAEYYAHPSAFVDDGATIGKGTKIWHFSHISSGATLGADCNLGQNVFVATGVTLGRNVKVQNNVSIYAGTEVHDDVFLGPSCVLTNVTNPRSQVVRRNIYEKTVLRRGATIGANATIVCGVELGRYSFVAAGAVVTDDVPDYGMVKGVPARLSGWMSRHGHVLSFDPSGKAVCPESGLEYRYKVMDGVPSVQCVSIPEDEPLPEGLRLGTRSYDMVRDENRHRDDRPSEPRA